MSKGVQKKYFSVDETFLKRDGAHDSTIKNYLVVLVPTNDKTNENSLL